MMKKIFISVIMSAVCMTVLYAQQYKVGTTSAIWKKPTAANFVEAKKQGVEYLEVAFNQCYRGVPASEVNSRIQLMKEQVDSANIKVWSIHLPFSRTLDISVLNDSLRKANVDFMVEMIKQCKQFKPSRLVLHPSSEPIDDNERAKRMENAIASIKYLKPFADKIGAKLCIENLPRTCLGNTPEEMLTIMQNVPGIYICFDTNHYFKGTTEHFMEVVGKYVATIHASDYDFKNECHWLPTQGDINWKRFVQDLRKNGYKGVFMYEAIKDCANGNQRPTPARIVETYEQILND